MDRKFWINTTIGIDPEFWIKLSLPQFAACQMCFWFWRLQLTLEGNWIRMAQRNLNQQNAEILYNPMVRFLELKFQEGPGRSRWSGELGEVFFLASRQRAVPGRWVCVISGLGQVKLWKFTQQSQPHKNGKSDRGCQVKQNVCISCSWLPATLVT